MHFLMSCSKYDKTRQDLFSIVGMTCINFQNLSIEEIFLWLMTCENDLVLKEMCQFICKYCRWFFFLSDISIASCSSALDTRRSVRFIMLHFLEYHLWRSTFYWNSMGNNIFIIFSRKTQQNTTKLGTFVNFMCVYKCPVRSQ